MEDLSQPKQVEDVKTFFRILLVVVISLPLTCLVFFAESINIHKVYLCFDNHSSVSYQNTAVAFFVVISILVGRLLFHLVKFPLYCGSFYVKFLVGGVFLLIYSLLSFSLEIAALERNTQSKWARVYLILYQVCLSNSY